MSDLLFAKDHEWIRVDGDVGTVGISNFAQQQLGDVVFVELPDIGRKFAQNDEAAVVESVKVASEVYTPVSGEIVEINGELDESPELVNSDPTGAAWFFKIRIADAAELGELMDEAAYKAFVDAEG
jgi:glycine cleavage system H protein